MSQVMAFFSDVTHYLQANPEVSPATNQGQCSRIKPLYPLEWWKAHTVDWSAAAGDVLLVQPSSTIAKCVVSLQ